MGARTRRTLLAAGLLVMVATGFIACRGPCPPRARCRVPAPVPVVWVRPARAQPTRPETDLDARIAAAAEVVLARARAAEPETTAFVQKLASEAGGEVAGLAHRLKSRKATLGKFRRILDEGGDKGPEDVVLYDALRYMIVVEDEPVGHHDASVRTILAAIEARGDTVKKVKNYWPGGDSYSGVNCVLESADGLHWELQFHTPKSYEVKGSTHDDYERMRAPDTPLGEKRALFESMSRKWDRIPIPQDILEPRSLHDLEERVTLPAP